MKRLRKIRQLSLYVIVLFCIFCCVGPYVYILWRNQPPEFPPVPDKAVEFQEHEKQCRQGESLYFCSQGKDFFTEDPIENVVDFYEDLGATCVVFYDNDDCTQPGCGATYTCDKPYTSRKWYTVDIDENVTDAKYTSNLEVRVVWVKYDFDRLLDDISNLLE